MADLDLKALLDAHREDPDAPDRHALYVLLSKTYRAGRARGRIVGVYEGHLSAVDELLRLSGEAYARTEDEKAKRLRSAASLVRGIAPGPPLGDTFDADVWRDVKALILPESGQDPRR
jgi:hypothetical protein